MGFTADLLAGLGQLLEDRGVAQYAADSPYSEGLAAVIEKQVPQQPDRVVVLVPYPISDDPTLSDSTVGLQVRLRTPATGPAADVDDLADDVFDVFQNLGPVTLGEAGHQVRIVQMTRNSSAPLPADDLGRWERSDNYQIQAHRPSTNRI